MPNYILPENIVNLSTKLTEIYPNLLSDVRLNGENMLIYVNYLCNRATHNFKNYIIRFGTAKYIIPEIFIDLSTKLTKICPN